VSFEIKKNFFNHQKNDKSHGCEKVFGSTVNVNSEKENNDVEEYLNNYTTTTRWQTV